MKRSVKTNIYLYIILFSAVLVQVSFMRKISFFPDLGLLMVVFASLFKGGTEGAILGFVYGFLRGSFSPSTFPVDIFIFPVIGTVSSVFPKMFYRHKPIAQLVITFIAMLVLITVHVIYLNLAESNDVSVFMTIRASWPVIVFTICVSPFLFALLRTILKIEE